VAKKQDSHQNQTTEKHGKCFCSAPVACPNSPQPGSDQQSSLDLMDARQLNVFFVFRIKRTTSLLKLKSMNTTFF